METGGRTALQVGPSSPMGVQSNAHKPDKASVYGYLVNEFKHGADTHNNIRLVIDPSCSVILSNPISGRCRLLFVELY